jgi:hypothetical protein
MNNIVLQISIITGVLFLFGLILFFLSKNAFSLKYALLWLLSVAVMLMIGIFPRILVHFAYMLGFEIPSNALFALLLGFVIVILLQQTANISQQADKIKTLVQENALLEKRIRELEDGKTGNSK